MDPDHPINVISKQFVETYVDFYLREINQNVKQFHHTEKLEFQVSVSTD